MKASVFTYDRQKNIGALDNAELYVLLTAAFFDIFVNEHTRVPIRSVLSTHTSRKMVGSVHLIMTS